MLRTVRLVLFILGVILISGCATSPAAGKRTMAAFPFHHNTFDFRTAWQTTHTPQGVMLDVMMKNIRFAQVEGLEVTVSALDPGRKERAEASAFPLPRPFMQDEYRDFSLLLKNLTLSPGHLLRFQFQYRALEGDRSGFRWITTFTVNAMTGQPLIPPEEQSTGQ